MLVADSASSIPSAEPMKRSFPDVLLHGSLDGHVSLFSSERARAAIGYRPRRNWRD